MLTYYIICLTKNSGYYNERCYNEQCLSIKSGYYNEQMLQRTVFNNKFRMLQRTMLQRTVFINKIRMLQRTTFGHMNIFENFWIGLKTAQNKKLTNTPQSKHSFYLARQPPVGHDLLNHEVSVLCFLNRQQTWCCQVRRPHIV